MLFNKYAGTKLNKTLASSDARTRSKLGQAASLHWSAIMGSGQMEMPA